MLSRLHLLRILACLCTVAAAPAFGGDASPAPVTPPADIIRYRQTTMRSLGTHFKALNAVVSKKVPYVKHAPLHAKAVADLAQAMGELFPKGTGPGTGETDALAAVWSENAKWTHAVEQFRTEAEKLSAAAATATDVTTLRAQLEAVNDSCASCHKAFRAEK